MSGILRNVFFILKSIEISDIFQRFSVFLKIENYDFVEMDTCVKSDLPKGLNFPVLLGEKWFEKPEFEVEIRTKGKIFAGIFDIEETEKVKNFSISGVTTVYNVRDAADHLSIELAVLVEEPKIDNRVEIEKIMVTRETQTTREPRKSVKNGETQVGWPGFKNLGSSYSNPILKKI
ncbi:hypothetical protein CRE_05824 [Caenorhabditis remanei]|uniref:Uncharacterized protein n=1 Tax=Caenorhabditis remanei TaxID=31234 RepID=E3MNJ5_CAERE|nr:hypothetical protein CRE_05824 [Caenorhabditis remanei]